METCDHCGPSTRAQFTARRGKATLHLCGHCANQHREQLIQQGFCVRLIGGVTADATA